MKRKWDATELKAADVKVDLMDFLKLCVLNTLRSTIARKKEFLCMLVQNVFILLD